MPIRLLAAAAVTCLFSHASLAQDASADSARPAKEKKICRAESPTGSIMAKRVCRTRAEWSKLAEQNERQNETIRDRSSGPISGSTSGQ